MVRHGSAEFGMESGEAVFVAALAGGRSVRDAARQADISERTAYRRLADPAFRRAVQDARSRIVAEATGRLAALSTAAAEALGRLLRAKSENVRLSAARAVLELQGRLRETEELEQRIAELEALSNAGKF